MYSPCDPCDRACLPDPLIVSRFSCEVTDTLRASGVVMASAGQKVVLITGCSSGIGLRMAVMLAKDPQKRFHGRCFKNRLQPNTCSFVSLPIFQLYN